MAVANAVLDVIEKDDLKNHGIRVGNFMLKGLNNLKEKYSCIGDVRGAGMFLGVDMVADRKTKEPATQIAEYIVKRFKDEKILMSTEGKYGNVLKFKPPMTFTTENATQWFKVFEMILEEVHMDEIRSRSISELSSLSMDSLESDNPISTDDASDS